jgi:hypothetical protein
MTASTPRFPKVCDASHGPNAKAIAALEVVASSDCTSMGDRRPIRLKMPATGVAMQG